MMLDDIQKLAELFGWSPAKVQNTVSEWQQERNTREVKRHLNEELVFANYRKECSLLAKYYGLEDAGNSLKRYSVKVNGQEVPTAIYTIPEHVGLDRSPLKVPMNLHTENYQIPKVTDEARNYAIELTKRFVHEGRNIWNQSIYRLISYGSIKKPQFDFCEIDFYTFRFTTGLITNELIDTLVKYKGDVDAVIANRSTEFPIREHVLPNISSFTDFKSRICCGGMGVVFAIARGEPNNDFLITIHERSLKVSVARKRLSVLPNAFHQASIDSHQEVNIYWTVFRELYEEVFGGEEVERDNERLNPQWYFDLCPGLEYFKEHTGAFEFELLGYGVNAIGGQYDMSLLLAVRDEWYWRKFRNEMKKMWETSKVIHVSTKDEHQIADLLTKGNWTTSSVFNFTEGLLRLEAIAPNRVKLPKIERVFGSGG